MERLPTPIRTSLASRWMEGRDADADVVQRALLATVDGRRNLVQLESVARAMGLDPTSIEQLRQRGLIAFADDRPGAGPRAT